MMMINSLTLICFLGGILLGSIFYGGLWITVKYGIHSKNSALWFLLSFIIRIAITLAGFYYLMGNQWFHLVVCLAGFIASRVLITQLTKIIPIKENEK